MYLIIKLFIFIWVSKLKWQHITP